MLVFIKKVFPTLMNMTMIEYVQLALVEHLTTSCISIPRCPKGPTIFLQWLLISSPPIWREHCCWPKHIVVGYFEPYKVVQCATMAMKLKHILHKFTLIAKDSSLCKG